MSEPIIVNFYDENDEVIKTFSRSRISWEFFKRAQSTRPPENGDITEDNLRAIRQLVCDFYDNQFTEEELIKFSSVNEILLISTEICYRLIKLLKEQGITLPNAETAAE